MLIQVVFLNVSSGKAQLSCQPPWSRLTEHWMWRGERVHAADHAAEAGQVKLVEIGSSSDRGGGGRGGSGGQGGQQSIQVT